jgi:hypothetical protein
MVHYFSLSKKQLNTVFAVFAKEDDEEDLYGMG